MSQLTMWHEDPNRPGWLVMYKGEAVPIVPAVGQPIFLEVDTPPADPGPGPALHEALAAAGYTSAPASPGRRHIIDATGRVVFTGFAHEVWAWLKADPLPW